MQLKQKQCIGTAGEEAGCLAAQQAGPAPALAVAPATTPAPTLPPPYPQPYTFTEPTHAPRRALLAAHVHPCADASTTFQLRSQGQFPCCHTRILTTVITHICRSGSQRHSHSNSNTATATQPQAQNHPPSPTSTPADPDSQTHTTHCPCQPLCPPSAPAAPATPSPAAPRPTLHTCPPARPPARIPRRTPHTAYVHPRANASTTLQQ